MREKKRKLLNEIGRLYDVRNAVAGFKRITENVASV